MKNSWGDIEVGTRSFDALSHPVRNQARSNALVLSVLGGLCALLVVAFYVRSVDASSSNSSSSSSSSSSLLSFSSKSSLL